MSDKPAVITDPLTNRGTAFTLEQRRELGLIGRLPSAVETLDEQARRAYTQLRSQSTDMARYIFLDQLHNRNEVLYYRLLVDHLQELLPDGGGCHQGVVARLSSLQGRLPQH